MATPTDEELMAAYVGGDGGAFDEIFRRYAPKLHRAMRRQLRNPDDADELVQQTFLHLHRARRDFRPGSRLRPWIYTIAFNLRREFFRKRARRPETLVDFRERDTRSTGLTAEDGMVRAQAAEAMRKALEALTEDQREVVVLHWFEELPFAEIAQIVGTSVGTAKVRAHRGYAKLRQVLERESGNRSRPRDVQPLVKDAPDDVV